MKNISVYNVVLPNKQLSNVELLDAAKKIEIPGSLLATTKVSSQKITFTCLHMGTGG